MTKTTYACLAGAILIAPTAALGADFKTVASIGYDGGNDDLIRVAFVDGETNAVKANQGFGFLLGALFHYGASADWQMQTGAGVKYRAIESSNGEIRFTSYPVELIGFYNTDMVRFGMGATYQVDPKVKTTGAVGGHDVDLDNALGYIVQIGFRTGKQGGFSVDFRYTAIEFSGEATRNGARQPLEGVSGDSAGIYLSAIF